MTRQTAPTQVQHPIRTALRTFFQVLLAVLLAAPVAAPVIAETIEALLPGSEYPTIVLGAGFALGTIGGGLAALAAVPQVNALLTRFGLGATPKGEG